MQTKAKWKVIVSKIFRETVDVKRFILSSPSGAPLPAFGGGSHITTWVRDGNTVWERQYSLINDAAQTGHYEIAVKLQPSSRGGSRFWHEAVHEGMELDISYPKNHFPLSFSAKHHLFYAAGIGITPFLSMMAELKRKGGSFELHYAARSKEQCAFYDFLRQQYGDCVRFYFSQGEQPQRMLPDGMKDQPVGTHVYFCGPHTMVAQFREAAQSCGYIPEKIHYELFQAPVQTDPQPFDVELKKSGKLLRVEKDQSLLDALLDAGVRVPCSCRAGGCGTCAIRVLAGEVEHHDACLTEEEKRENIMIACVSRGKGKLLLDL